MHFIFVEDIAPGGVGSGGSGEVYVIDMLSSRLNRFEDPDEKKDGDGTGCCWIKLTAVP